MAVDVTRGAMWNWIRDNLVDEPSVTYHEGPPLQQAYKLPPNVYYGADGKRYVKKKPYQYESEDQRRFIMATRRGAVQDPKFTPEEAAAFVSKLGRFS